MPPPKHIPQRHVKASGGEHKCWPAPDLLLLFKFSRFSLFCPLQAFYFTFVTRYLAELYEQGPAAQTLLKEANPDSLVTVCHDMTSSPLGLLFRVWIWGYRSPGRRGGRGAPWGAGGARAAPRALPPPYLARRRSRARWGRHGPARPGPPRLLRAAEAAGSCSSPARPLSYRTTGAAGAKNYGGGRKDGGDCLPPLPSRSVGHFSVFALRSG